MLAAGDTQDLIQTRCVPDSGLTRPKTKKSTERKIYKKKTVNENIGSEIKKICRKDGKATHSRLNFVKCSRVKLIQVICVALLNQTMIPAGWKKDNIIRFHSKEQTKQGAGLK